MVLGVQWFITLGPIWWDFSNLRMEFHLNDVKHVLRGVTKTGCKVIKGDSLNKILLQEPQISFLHIREVNDSHTSNTLLPDAMLSYISASGTESDIEATLQPLLESYVDLFAEPTHLPPFREGFDHNIPLVLGANPVNQRPYRYSSLQKDVIDKMIKEMLHQGII